MKKFKDVKVKYTHPAIPPIGIEVGTTYIVGDLISKYESDDLIESMFTPIGLTWKKLRDKNDKNKPKRVVVDNSDLDVVGERAE